MFEIILKCAKEKIKTKVVCPYSKGYVLVSQNTRGCHEIPEYVTKYQRVSRNTRDQQELQKKQRESFKSEQIQIMNKKLLIRRKCSKKRLKKHDQCTWKNCQTNFFLVSHRSFGTL